MKGRLTYSLHSVAFPTVPNHRGVIDDLNISFDARGGGTHGEFSFEFYKFESTGGYGVRLGVFGDGLGAFLDPRVQQVIQRWYRCPSRDRLKPETFVRWFEEVGAVPSEYHQAGLKEQRR